MKSALLSELARGSLVELVPGLEEAFIEHGIVHRFSAGVEVGREGEPVEHLLIPIDAPLRLVDAKSGVEIGRLEAKRSLALREAMDARPYRYTSRTERETTAAMLPAEELRRLLQREPKIGHYLRLMTRSAGVRAFRRHLAERGVSASDLVELVSRIEPESLVLGRGEAVPVSPPALYFSSGGTIEIRGRDDVSFAAPEGTWFGGETLVPPHRASYRAEVRSSVRLHRAPLSAIGGLLERLDLIEGLYDEPALSRGLERSSAREAEAEPLPLEPASPGVLGSELDPRRIVRSIGPRAAFPATLRNAALLLGVTVNPARLESGLSLRRRVGLLALAEELEVFGVITSPQTVSPAEIGSIRFPALALVSDRPLLLLAAESDRVLVLDAVQGPGWIEAAALHERTKGQTLELRRDSTTDPVGAEATDVTAPKASTTLRTVRELLFRDRMLLVSFAGLTLTGMGLGLVSPLFLRYLLDEVLLLGSIDLLAGLMIGLAITTVLSSVVSMGRTHVLTELTMRLDADLSRAFYRRALSLPTAFYERVKVGDVLARLHEVGRIRDFFSTRSVESVIDLLSIFVYAAALLAFSLPIGLTALVLVIVLVILQLAMRKPLRRLYELAFEAGRRNRSVTAEMFGAITAVKASGAEPVLRRRFEETAVAGLEARRRLGMRVASTQALMNVTSTLGTAGVLWFVCLAALEGRLSVGSILASSMYLQSILAPVRRLSSLLAEAEEVRVASAKLDEVLTAPSEEDPARARVTHAVRLRGKLRLEHVSFRYGPDRPLVLRDISLTIYPGQRVAVVGRSGSGKSTLVNLLAGLYRPVSGRIYYDDHDSAMVGLSALRRQIGFVRQDFQLFAGTIGENIAHGDDAPDRERIERAARLSYADEFVTGLPRGYEHFLPAGGVGLSGGQKQRIAIARVIYGDPKILIMDEALSALDAESESAINGNMSDISAGRTTIIVAHRLSTVMRADRIIVIDAGAVVEEGDHDSLLRRRGLYSELFEGQLIEGELPA